MMTIPFQHLDEKIVVKLERTQQHQNDTARMVRKLISHINRLELQVRELQQCGTRGLVPLSGDAGISQEQLIVFSREFREDYKTFRQAQLNTTEVDAFMRWKTSAPEWSIQTDYLARVRNLSMHIPQWTVDQYNSGAVDGLYGPGCWKIQRIVPVGRMTSYNQLECTGAFQSISPDMKIVGPILSLILDKPTQI